MFKDFSEEARNGKCDGYKDKANTQVHKMEDASK